MTATVVKLTRYLETFAFLLCLTAVSAFETRGQVKAENPQAKEGLVSVCKEIDDDWKCVGEASPWEANKRFNVLFINPIPVTTDFIGIIFHKQLADGKDGEFLYEFQQQIGSGNRKYATTEAPFFLPAGTYTLYILSWGRRDTLVHKGNFTDYYAKITLKVK